MKRLVLIRHAKSSWDDGAISDFDRPLNARGQHDAPRMGAWLREKGITPDLIYSSPAQRALSTARLIAHETGYSLADIITKDILYRFDNELLPIIRCVKNSADSAQSIFYLDTTKLLRILPTISPNTASTTFRPVAWSVLGLLLILGIALIKHLLP
ncbi:MAG: histidine phosphatase family protein [Sphingobacteriales bacterium]|nr:histidine phosphatase family protein [Sphingobacteriales bacterium]